MAYQSQDIIRRSATNGLTPAPQARDFQEEVAKLIDVTTCIGCKACQVACSEWNDIRDTVGNNIGVYDNPNDLSAKSWTVMPLLGSGAERQTGMADPQRRLYALFRSRLPESVPGGRCNYSVCQRIVDFQSEQCIGCGYCIAGCPFDIPRLNPEDNRVYKCTLCVDRVVVGQEPACVKTCPTGAIHFGTKESMKTLASERVAELKTRRLRQCGSVRSGRRRWYTRHVRAAPC
ncbi:formate dehydrogenase-O [Escherichia coli]|uniref:Formate dehydrogenase-O n=1 Tax=Escherichia coli TaxID=562 RepID=A0A2X1KC21_ECOLX|nr:formate dehydrogenase-O [Escherichia coli]